MQPSRLRPLHDLPGYFPNRIGKTKLLLAKMSDHLNVLPPAYPLFFKHLPAQDIKLALRHAAIPMGSLDQG